MWQDDQVGFLVGVFQIYWAMVIHTGIYKEYWLICM